MVKKDFKRYFFSWGTVLAIVALLATAAMSLYDSYEYKELMMSYVGMPTHHDPVKLAALIQSLDITEFLLSFWSDDSSSFLFPIVVLIWEGVFLSNVFMTQKESGQGNQFLTRMSFNKYIKNTICAQSLYIGAIFGIFIILLYIISIILGGINTDVNISKILIVLVFQPINIYVMLVLLNIISLFFLMFFNNKYVSMAAPVVVLDIVPFVICSTVGNMSDLAAEITSVFIPCNVINLPAEMVDSTNSYIQSFCGSEITVVIYVAVAVILYFLVQKKFSRDYI